MVPGNFQLAFAETQSCFKILIVASQTNSTIPQYGYSCVDFPILSIPAVFVHGERIRYGTDATTQEPRNTRAPKSIRSRWFRCCRRSAQLTHLFRIIPTAEISSWAQKHHCNPGSDQGSGLWGGGTISGNIATVATVLREAGRRAVLTGQQSVGARNKGG